MVKVPKMKKALGVHEIPKSQWVLHHGHLLICIQLSNKPEQQEKSLPQYLLHQQKYKTKEYPFLRLLVIRLKI